MKSVAAVSVMVSDSSLGENLAIRFLNCFRIFRIICIWKSDFKDSLSKFNENNTSVVSLEEFVNAERQKLLS